MGVIKRNGSGETFVLLPRTVVGRSHRCELRCQVRAVSGHHAEIVWNRDRWELKDLGSKNGTFVDGIRLPAGHQKVLRQGALIAFGPSDEAWRVISLEGPVIAAMASNNGRIVRGQGELLALPDMDSPQITIYTDNSGYWVCERTGESPERINDGAVVNADGVDWRLYIPMHMVDTIEATPLAPTLESIGLRFEVSREEEHVDLVLITQEGERRLKHRAHHYLLLTLARERVSDQEDAEVAESAAGWVFQDRLIKMIGDMDNNRLNVNIFRARKALTEAGIEGATDIVERRGGSRQLRLGTERIEILTV